MWRTKGIVLENVNIEQYITELKNMIIPKQMQWELMYPNCRLYSNERQSFKAIHIWGECSMRYIAIA